MRTFVPPTSFVSSPETENERLLYSCANVASGFYSRHGWIILPKPVKDYKSVTEVIPETAKNFSPEFWKDAARGGSLMPKVLSKQMWKESGAFHLGAVDSFIVKKFESEWKKIEKDAWIAVTSMFPKEHKWIKSLEVRITNIGSSGSHYLLTKNKTQHLIINLRVNSDYKEILNLIVLALIYPYEKDLGLSFTHRQTVRNFIMTRPEFKRVYPDFVAKTFDNPKIPIMIKRKSDEYIKFLGIPNIVDPTKTITENAAIFGVKENKLVQELIKNRGEILTYDDIADIVWGQGEFKSYWAINKLVQRIQTKINSLNINFRIQGIRGRGYKII